MTQASSEKNPSAPIRNVSIGQLLQHISKSIVVCARSRPKILTKTFCFFFFPFLSEVPCHSKEDEGVITHDHGVEELSPCSVITGYTFTTRTHRQYKLLISANETQKMVEFNGDVNMKVYG